MKQLYLIRHAKSSWSDNALSDFDRPLNGRGKRDGPVMGRRLAAAGIRPELVLASPAKRARRTARAITAEIGYAREDIVLVDALYTFDRDGLLAVLSTVDDQVTTLALVGHNAAITECAEWLTGERLGNVPTCGVVAISFAEDSWRRLGKGAGTLVFFDYPKRCQQRDQGR